MSLRSPVLPPFKWLAIALGALGTVMGVASGLWSQSAGPSLGHVGFWLGVSLFTTMLPLVVHPLLSPSGLGSASLPGPPWWAWWRLFGAFFSLAMVGSALRAWATHTWGTWPTHPWAQVAALMGNVLAILVLLWYAEHEAALRQACIQQDEANQAQIEKLFLARSSLVRNQLRRQHELWVLLSEGVSPGLSRLQADLAKLLQQAESPKGLPDAVAKSWQADLETFREGQVRQLSQLLHPSVLEDGLLPALRALVRAYEAHTLVRWGLSPSAQALLAQKLPEAWALGFYRIVEALLDHGLRQAEGQALLLHADREEGALVVSLGAAGQGLVQALSRQEPGLALLDSRVALLGGHWDMGQGPDGGPSWRLRLPEPELKSWLGSGTGRLDAALS